MRFWSVEIDEGYALYAVQLDAMRMAQIIAQSGGLGFVRCAEAEPLTLEEQEDGQFRFVARGEPLNQKPHVVYVKEDGEETSVQDWDALGEQYVPRVNGCTSTSVHRCS